MFYGQISRKLQPRTAISIFNRSYIPGKPKIDDILQSTLEQAPITSTNDWKNVKQAVLAHQWNRGNYTEANVDALIIAYCTSAKQYELASSYFSFLTQENIKPNLATVGKYFKLLYLKNQEDFVKNGKCSGSEEKLILKLYGELNKQYPILDSLTLENAVAALSITKEWKKCINLLEEIKISAIPNMSSYSAVVSAAFLNKEESLGWKLLEEMMENDRTPRDVAFLAYVKAISKIREKDEALKCLEKLFMFFQENALICPQNVAVCVDSISEKLGLRSHFAAVTGKGICSCCHKKLEDFTLSTTEFEELKTKVLENVIVGRDLFVRTTPDELERFKEFAAGMGKFDVVLDGLNVAFSAGTKQSPAVFASLVASVVHHFVRQGKKVLVLGRVHMNRWPRKFWDYVVQNSTLFLAQNISQDDPYLLYCALNSGRDTIIVTRDLMRSHKFLLKSPRHKVLFNRWLLQRQYQLLTVDSRRGPIFRVPPPYSVLAQKNADTWHVPYEPITGPKIQSESPIKWLCLKTLKS